MSAALADDLRDWAIRQGACLVGFADLARVQATWPQSFLAYGPLLVGMSILVSENHDLLEGLPTTDDRSRTSHYNVKIALGLRIASGVRDRLLALGHRAAVLNHPPKPPEKPTGLLKAAARLAGLGWIGKNRLLITPSHGPRVAPALVLTYAPLPTYAGPPLADGCKGCTRCIDICPGRAFSRYPFGETDSMAGFSTGRCAQVRGIINPTGWGACSLCVQACPYGARTTASPSFHDAFPFLQPVAAEAPT
jgi:epoxyqueuosine reductase QueG